MVRIAPVRLSFNPKTLWFDAGQLELRCGDAVVVSTVRGDEFGRVSQALFDMPYEKVRKLRSPLKSVKRLATDEDVTRSDELSQLSIQALPVFKRMARESVPDMNPVAVEYLFGSDKAVFYFESEERVDFRDLVRKLAAEFHVRVDMKQIGVRDGARMVGGLGHCGQELCCRRLGGDFNPVSIRMAKEQDLSLNPQKISGVCGRLMCCLRYEYDAYKDFHGRAPKKNARIQTPAGEGKVVDLDVPREVVSIKVDDEKPVKVPLVDMDKPDEGSRPSSVGQEAWDRANEPAVLAAAEALNLFTSQLSGNDKLAEPGKVRHVHGSEGSKKSSRSRSRRRGSKGGNASGSEASTTSEKTRQSHRKSRRRRSTTVKSDGAATTEKQSRSQQSQQSQQQKQKSSSKSRSRNKQSKPKEQKKSVQVGRNSSALRANRPDQEQASKQKAANAKPLAKGAATSQEKGAPQDQGNDQGSRKRRRRRTHKANFGDSEGDASKQ